MKTILVPTDFSENANFALHYAAMLAHTSGANLILLHTENSQVAVAESLTVMDPDPEFMKGCNQKMKEQADQLMAAHHLNQLPEIVCVTGVLSLRLNETIKARQVDLVVMGTKGATNFFDKILGTNTAAFIKVALCPVLIIPPKASYQPFTRIAYAADFQSDERIILHQLLDFAEPLKAEVYVVNIKSERQLKTITDDQVLFYIQHEFPDFNLHINQIKEEDVVKGLREFVEQNDMHVLAVAIHDRNFIEEFFHKSITRQLALNTHVPLLALPTRPFAGRPEIKPKPNW